MIMITISYLVNLKEFKDFFYYCPLKLIELEKKRADLRFGVQPFLVIFELPHLKVNHKQKYTFFRTADIWPVYKVLKQGQDSSN